MPEIKSAEDQKVKQIFDAIRAPTDMEMSDDEQIKVALNVLTVSLASIYNKHNKGVLKFYVDEGRITENQIIKEFVNAIENALEFRLMKIDLDFDGIMSNEAMKMLEENPDMFSEELE